MFIKCKTLEKAYDKFAKAYNEAVADGLLGGHFETLAEWKLYVKGEWTLADNQDDFARAIACGITDYVAK